MMRLLMKNALLLLLLLCSFMVFSQSLTIEEAIDFWVLDGRNFNNVDTCKPLSNFQDKKLIILTDTSSCTLSEIAVYTLLTECNDPLRVENVNVLDYSSYKSVLNFDINDSICSSVMRKLNKINNISKSKGISNKNLAYVIQFYAGKNEPKSGLNSCVKIPLYLHKINEFNYLFSEVYNSYKIILIDFLKLKEQCPKQDMWIRPIYLEQ